MCNNNKCIGTAMALQRTASCVKESLLRSVHAAHSANCLQANKYALKHESSLLSAAHFSAY